jgi:hypothetical protein
VQHLSGGAALGVVCGQRDLTVAARGFKSIRRSEGRTRWVVGCAVVLLHILILAFLTRASPRWHSPREIASTLVLLDLSPVAAVPNLIERPAAQQKPRLLMDDGSGERMRQGISAEGHESGPITHTSQSSSTAPLVDWSAELDTVAKVEVPELLAERLQKCHEAELHGRLLIGCGKAKPPDIWTSHKGLAGFFAIGKREANGHIFDDMRDPDRERSSVPDIVALQAGPHRPLPLAFDPRRDYFTH